ncbi:hypothetical protein ACWDSD_44540 [Streptomyces spiralis]
MLRRAPETVCRELRRNSRPHDYGRYDAGPGLSSPRVPQRCFDPEFGTAGREPNSAAMSSYRSVRSQRPDVSLLCQRSTVSYLSQTT